MANILLSNISTGDFKGDSGFSGYSGAGQSGYSGISGFSGYSGISGFSGYSGISGFSGYSGTVGISGFSGWSGYSGQVGTSGFSGWSGYSGQVGTSGFSGWSGYSGQSGWSGYSGQSGWSGYSGEVGTSGFSGWSGYSGQSGWSGYSGQSGWSGYSGEVGTSGFSGWSGYSGTGTSGWSGWSGYSGQVGTSGWSGWSGYSGQSGWSGYSGVLGTSGWSGWSGYSGQSGWSGYSGTGTSGWSGYSGQVGTSGWSGYSGTSGIPGIPGGYGSSWTYSNNTTVAGVTSGQIRLNNTVLSSATQIGINDTDAASQSQSTFLAGILIADRTRITLANVNNTAWATYLVTSVTDGGTYYTCNITYQTSAGSFTDGQELQAGFALDGVSGYSGSASSVVYMEMFQPNIIVSTNTVAAVQTQASWHMHPFQLPQGITGGHINILQQNAGVASSFFQQAVNFTSNSSGTISRYFTYANRLALYNFFTNTSGANSTDIGKISTYWTGSHDWYMSNVLQCTNGGGNVSISNYATIQMITQIDQAGNYTTGNFTASSSSSYAGSLVSSSVTPWVSSVVQYISGSIKNMIPVNTSLAPSEYILGYMNYTSSSSTTSGQYGGGGTVAPASNLSNIGILGMIALSSYKQVGRSTTANTTGVLPYHGYVATTSTGAIATLNKSDLRVFSQTSGSVSGAYHFLYWNYINNIVS